ncbi:MAG: hypothetical protein ACI9DC_002728, partial [Gammaproteobacteria bacterium]
ELAQQAAPSPSPSQEAGSGAALGERSMYLPSTRTFEPVAIFDRYRLPAGTELVAPVVLVEPESTLVVACKGQVRVLDSGTVEVLLDLEDASSKASGNDRNSAMEKSS